MVSHGVSYSAWCLMETHGVFLMVPWNVLWCLRMSYHAEVDPEIEEGQGTHRVGVGAAMHHEAPKPLFSLIPV